MSDGSAAAVGPAAPLTPPVPLRSSKGEITGKVILLVVAVAMIAIGAAGLINVDFGALGKPPLYATIPLVVVGTGLSALALWVLLRKQQVQQEVISSEIMAKDPVKHPRAVDENGYTALHYVMMPFRPTGDDSEVDADDVRESEARALLSQGVDINAKTREEGTTPLHMATFPHACMRHPVLGNSNVMQLLLEHRADPNSQDVFHNTPLHYLANLTQVEEFNPPANNSEDRDRVIDLSKKRELRRPVLTKEELKPIWEMFVKAGAKVDIPNRKGQTPQQILDMKYSPWLHMSRGPLYQGEDALAGPPLTASSGGDDIDPSDDN